MISVDDSGRMPEYRVDGNVLRLLDRGPSRFDALLALVDRASRSIQLFFYIFADDDCGQAMRDALLRARARGVDVSLLIDGFGSQDRPDSFFQPLVDAGAVFARFLPGFGRHYLLRNHQKMLIADRQAAIVGGCNIERGYFAESADGDHWVDLMVRIEGPAVARLAAYFDDLEAWIRTHPNGLRTFRALLLRHSAGQEDAAVAWLFAGPFARLSPLTRDIRRKIATARSMTIVAAYFAPTVGMIRRLGQLARRGRLRIITPSRTDNLTTIYAARHCYARLLKNGAMVEEYQPARLHMKLIVADDTLYVGSANFDIRSLFINAELMMRVRDPAFVAQARTLIDAMSQDSRRITQEKLDRAAGFWARQIWRIAYYLVATLDPTVTRRVLRRVLQAEAAVESSFHAQ